MRGPMRMKAEPKRKLGFDYKQDDVQAGEIDNVEGISGLRKKVERRKNGNKVVAKRRLDIRGL